MKRYRSLKTGEVIEGDLREYEDGAVTVTISRWIIATPNGLDATEVLYYTSEPEFREEWAEL